MLTLQGGRFFEGHWFYKMIDTALAVKGEDLWTAMSPKRIFRASAYDNTRGYQTTYPFAVIDRYNSLFDRSSLSLWTDKRKMPFFMSHITNQSSVTGQAWYAACFTVRMAQQTLPPCL